MSGKNGKAEIKVLICVPSFRGSVMSHTMVAISRTVFLLAKLGIDSDVVNVDSAEITLARNSMASYALRQHQITHLLFIDDDMTFEADAVIDLLRCDKPIIGYVCPKRILDQKKVYDATLAGASFDAAITAGLEFVHRHIPNATLTVTEGMCPVRGIGMGVTLIKMSTFQTMIDKGVVNMPEPGTAESDAGFIAGPIIGFFDPLYSENDGRFLSEDLSFCERWHVQCGGEVWAKVDRKIGHIGQYIFAGNYMDRLKTGTT